MNQLPCYDAVAAWTLALETARLRGALRGSNSTDELDVTGVCPLRTGCVSSSSSPNFDVRNLYGHTVRSRWFAVRILELGKGSEVWRLHPLAVIIILFEFCRNHTLESVCATVGNL